eukprot:TRINITY_DN4777_c0_g1_i3.p1 TRINITY_DN4777_c0_g1~~TRINITY_DN4777_c0_g1_i3.p1  ORF type:complete len:231 (-),score=48.54 TRINITY_DN4777_c0_g1_i3:28-720(-)
MSDNEVLDLEYGINPSAFNLFLKFLYTGDLSFLDIPIALDILSFLHYFSLSSECLENACMAVCVHYVSPQSFYQIFDSVWKLRSVPSCLAGEAFIGSVTRKLSMFCSEEMDEILRNITDLDKALYMIKILSLSKHCGNNMEESLECRDRRACYILDSDLNALCGKEQFCTMKEIHENLSLQAKKSMLECPRFELEKVVPQELLPGLLNDSLTPLQIFPHIARHLTKLPFH